MSLTKEDPISELGAEDAETRKASPVSWLTVVAVGWVLYELTAQPAAGVMAICLKFGWEDFRTALWLRRTDPQRQRGRACFWLYVAWGLWKTALVALALVITYLFVLVLRGGAANQMQVLEDVLSATSLTMLAGFALSTLTFLHALCRAYWGEQRLWLSKDVHLARRRGDWPPSPCEHKPSNHLGALLLTIHLIVTVPAIILASIVFTIYLNNPLIATISALGLVGAIGSFLFLQERVIPQVEARSLAECWDPHERLPGSSGSSWYDQESADESM